MSGAIGEPSISPEALEAAQAELVMGSLQGWKITHLTRAVIRAYLKAARAGAYHPPPGLEVLMLANLAIGAATEFPDTTARETWRSRFKTARKIAGNPHLRFQMARVGGFMTITRLPDGVHPKHHRPPGKRSTALAAMAPGDGLVAPWPKIEASDKITARRLLGDSAAQWKQRATEQGLMITRVA